MAEVTESYREAIVQTVKHLTGRHIARDLIQDYKNQGGWNNDWALSQKIAADLGVEVPYDTVVDYFNQIFIGKNGDGLIQREQWFPKPGLLERLRERFGLAIFTGRLQYEAEITLKRFAPDCAFDPLLCAEHVTQSKPAPEGLLTIQQMKPGTEALVYRRYRRRRTLRSRGWCAVHRDRRTKPFPAGRNPPAVSRRESCRGS